jgi:hypothetical protein
VDAGPGGHDRPGSGRGSTETDFGELLPLLCDTYAGLAPADFLAMPECLMLAFVDRADAVRAMRLLDAAQAAALPYLSKEDGQKWHAEQVRRLGPRLVRADGVPSRRTSPFFINGQPIAGADLRRSLSGQLGGRLRA